MQPLWWTAREFGQLLGLHRSTVHRRCKAGRIPHEVNAGGIVVIPASVVDRMMRGLPMAPGTNTRSWL